MSLDIMLDKQAGGKVEANNYITKMLQEVQGLEVTDDQTFSSMTCYYKESRELKKLVDLAKEAKCAPYKKIINEANDIAKSLHAMLDNVEEVTKNKSGSYLKALEARQLEEQSAAELLDSSAILTAQPMEKSLRGEGAIVYTTKEIRFRVVDINSVPRKYLVLNETAIKQDIKLGVNEIAGIEIYEEEITKMRTR